MKKYQNEPYILPKTRIFFAPYMSIKCQSNQTFKFHILLIVLTSVECTRRETFGFYIRYKIMKVRLQQALVRKLK